MTRREAHPPNQKKTNGVAAELCLSVESTKPTALPHSNFRRTWPRAEERAMAGGELERRATRKAREPPPMREPGIIAVVSAQRARPALHRGAPAPRHARRRRRRAGAPSAEAHRAAERARLRGAGGRLQAGRVRVVVVVAIVLLLRLGVPPLLVCMQVGGFSSRSAGACASPPRCATS